MNNTILIVDDNPTDLKLSSALLSKNFNVIESSSGEEAISVLLSGDCAPQVIILDASMPGMNGYETCQIIKQNPDFAAVDIIFVSGHDSIEEKIKGYDAGASDFMVKPVQPIELIKKVNSALQHYTQFQNACTESKIAMETAMTAITDAGELSTVIHFMRESFQCTSVKSLAKLIVSSAAGFGLENSIILQTSHESIAETSGNRIPPLEYEVLSTLKNAKRIQQMGRRLILNFGTISQLIKNLPDDEEKCGRLRDHLALILEAATSRLKAITLMNEMKIVLDCTKVSISHYQENKTIQREANVQVMDDLMIELNDNLFQYGLTEEQENVLLKMVEKYNLKTLSLYEQGDSGDQELQAIANKIAQSVSGA
ncbi:PleD family two-component system response regulator [Marinomonas sp. IMCC 4694]|uniref:response regulator n=1 Tax=Marinomonas sp. IMCC 4694 TaxID=2605432 RepID=UPI0011E84E82|nr:response regulator [Marinomonas sp. IMCC 4694]TYL47594.1 response regulator [Marinomonas sp. IMCC 4694]